MKGDIFRGVRHAPGAPAAVGLPALGLCFPAGKFKAAISVGCVRCKESQPRKDGGVCLCRGGLGWDFQGASAGRRWGAWGARHPLLSPTGAG